MNGLSVTDGAVTECVCVCVYSPIICSAHDPLVVESDAAHKLLMTLQHTQTSTALNVPQSEHTHTHTYAC